MAKLFTTTDSYLTERAIPGIISSIPEEERLQEEMIPGIAE